MSETKENIVDIEQLIQDDHNFNKGTEKGAQLMEKSLQELGAGRSILIDKDGRIIAGNKTQEAAIKAGIKKVRIIETTGDELVAVKRTDISLDSKKGREMALADNATTQVNLAWDETELQAVMGQDLGLDFGEWGVDMPELAEAIDETEAEEDDFDERKDPVAIITQPGNLWQLGEHRLLCGDSTNLSDVQKLMGGELADLWLTDPPL